MASKVRGMKKVFVADVGAKTAPLTGFEVPTPGDEAVAGRSKPGYVGCMSQGRSPNGSPPRKQKLMNGKTPGFKEVGPVCLNTKV